VTLGDILFTKIEDKNAVEETKTETKSNSKKAAPSANNGEKKKKAPSGNEKGKSDAADEEGAGDDNQPDFTKVELRVGVIKRVWNHESADRYTGIIHYNSDYL
jgi:hypothetical protein